MKRLARIVNMKVFILILSFPLLVVLLSTRIAFTETSVEIIYKLSSLPPDIFGLPQERRLEIAKLGLKAVLSDEGMQAFKESGLFNEREIRHMEDVKGLVSKAFILLYVGLPLWIVLLVSLKNKTTIGKVLVFSSFFAESLIVLVVVILFLAFDLAFETFHLVLFDPHSWIFRDEDMLIRVYPQEFWFNASVLVAIFAFTITSVTLALGFLLWKRRL